jgi:hypothetical protein
MERTLAANNKNLEDATRGYNDAGEAVNEFGQTARQASAEVEDLNGAMSGIGSDAAKAGQQLGNIAKYAQSAGLEFEGMAKIAPIMQAGTASIRGMNSVIALKTPIVKVATGAQWAWNAAMAANPIGAVVVAVAALAAGIGALIYVLRREKDDTISLREEIKNLTDERERMAEAAEQSNNAFNEKIRSTETEIAVTQRLSDEIFNLAALENKSAEDKERIAAKVDLLNKSMEGLNLQYDAENDALNISQGLINQNITARKNLLMVRAKEDHALEIMREQIKLNRDIEKAEEALEAAREAARVSNFNFMQKLIPINTVILL